MPQRVLGHFVAMSIDAQDYLRRLRAMVSALEETEGVRVTHFSVQPGATAAEIAAAEDALGSPLPATLRAFYEAANGVQLLWTHEDHEDFDPDQADERTDAWLPMDSISDNSEFIGAISILKLAELPKTYPFLGESLRLFDVFNLYNWSAIELGSGDDPYVRVGDDHNATFENCRPIRLSSYLELTLTLHGGIEARRRALTGNGKNSEPELVHAPAPPVPIEEVLPEEMFD